ncbi:MAG: carboxypeptidase-like regulatory domain-containing protein, partial [Kiritimatiellaeota bacterium]|nr:carboxypeptidase-like regulatory domain-containing protein [Kiritimatiellota bacterium]
KKDVSTGQDEANQPVGKEGLTITGHVIGPDGKPVPAASVMQGISRWTPHSNTKTDKEGCFTLPKCATGELILTVEASGLAPDIRSIIVAPEIGPLEIKLGPGHTLRGRVVDPSGKPMAGVYVSADTWRKCRTLRWNTTTDSEGQFRWDGAPEDEVFYDMGKRNYMSVRNLSLAPSDKEHVVTMRLPLRITGRVTDAQTGQPIEAFVVVPGLAFSNTNTGALPEAWSRWETAHGGTGVYEIVFTEPARERGHLIRVEADGYVPGVSVPFGDDQQQPIDFLLTRGRIASGIVRLPDGRPASDATVLLGTRTEVAYVRNGRNLLQNERRAVKTGTDGRFAFPAEAAPFTLVVLHEQGCAKILDTELAALPEIVLQPWGRIEGTLRVGNKPGAGEKLAVWPDSNTPQVVQEYTTMAGQDGRFVFEKVPPGKSKVGRVIRTRWTENNWWEGPGHQVAVTVPPGQTVTIQVGGTGRAVVGRIVAPVGSTNGVNWPRVSYSGSIGLPQPAYPKDFDSMSPKEKRAWLDAWQTSAEGKAFIEAQRGRQILYVITVNADGSFRADDMPSGDYVLRVEAELTSKDNPGGQRTCVGKLRHPFTIPDIPGGRSDEPLDLGTLEVAGTWN